METDEVRKDGISANRGYQTVGSKALDAYSGGLTQEASVLADIGPLLHTFPSYTSNH